MVSCKTTSTIDNVNKPTIYVGTCWLQRPYRRSTRFSSQKRHERYLMTINVVRISNIKAHHFGTISTLRFRPFCCWLPITSIRDFTHILMHSMMVESRKWLSPCLPRSTWDICSDLHTRKLTIVGMNCHISIHPQPLAVITVSIQRGAPVQAMSSKIINFTLLRGIGALQACDHTPAKEGTRMTAICMRRSEQGLMLPSERSNHTKIIDAHDLKFCSQNWQRWHL